MKRSRTIAALGLLAVMGVATGIVVGDARELSEAAPQRSALPARMEDPGERRAAAPAENATRRAGAEETPTRDEGRRQGRSAAERDRTHTELEAPALEAPVLEAPVLETSVLETSVLETSVLETSVLEASDVGRATGPAPPGPLGTSRAPDAASSRDAGASRGLIMYATDWCPVCTRARRWMTAQEIEFEERDVEEDPAAARRHAELNPRRTVPTFERGERTLIGFSPQALRGLLEGPDGR